MSTNPWIAPSYQPSARSPVPGLSQAVNIAMEIANHPNFVMVHPGTTEPREYTAYLRDLWHSVAEVPLMSVVPAISQESPGILEWRLSRLESEAGELKSMLGEANRVLNETLDLLSSTTSRNTMLVHSIGLSGELLLRSPISLWIEEDEGQALAEAPEFHIVGEGATEPEAVTDAMIQLKDLYDDLMATPDEKLGALPKRWKRVLKNLVIDHAPNL